MADKRERSPAEPMERSDGGALGVLSVHFEAGRCRVRCSFCYLGQRVGADDQAAMGIEVELVAAALDRLDYRELALTLSEPIEPILPMVVQLARVAKGRGKLVAVTTTVAAVSQLLLAPASSAAGQLLGLASRFNLSIDPFKGQLESPIGQVEAADVAKLLERLAAKSPSERVLIVTLSTPRFAAELFDGLLGALVALPRVDRVALNALKPPPAWCDRDFWLRALAKISPLLRQHLDQRLFLDCYVAARILGLGACPARPDLSPAAPGGVAFRSCVYQPAPDFVVGSATELGQRLADFTVPPRCPFPID